MMALSFLMMLVIRRTSAKMYVLNILSLFVFISGILTECPEGWWKAGDDCYIASQQGMSWFHAQEVIHSLGILMKINILL